MITERAPDRSGGERARTVGLYIDVRFPALPWDTFHIEVPVMAATRADLSLAGRWDDPKGERIYWEYAGWLWKPIAHEGVEARRMLVERWIEYGRYVRANHPERARSGGLEDLPVDLRDTALEVAAAEAERMLAVDGEILRRTYGPVLRTDGAVAGRPSMTMDDFDDPAQEFLGSVLITDAMDYEGARTRLRACFPGVSMPRSRWEVWTSSPRRGSIAAFVAERQLWRFLERRRDVACSGRHWVDVVHTIRKWVRQRHAAAPIDWSFPGRSLQGEQPGRGPADVAELLPLVGMAVEMDESLPNDHWHPTLRMSLLDLEAAVGAEAPELEGLAI